MLYTSYITKVYFTLNPSTKAILQKFTLHLSVYKTHCDFYNLNGQLKNGLTNLEQVVRKGAEQI